TTSAKVTALTAASTFPSNGFVAVARGGSTPTKNSVIPTAAASTNATSPRCTGSRNNHGPSRRMHSGLASSRDTASAAVVSLFACTIRTVVKASATTTSAARHVHTRRASGTITSTVMVATGRRGPHRSGGPRASPRPLERRRDPGGAGQGRNFSHLLRGAARAATRVVPPQSDHSPPRSRRRRRRVSRPEPPRRARDAPHDPGQRRHRDSPLQRVRGGGPLRPGPPARRDSDHHGAVTLLLLIAALQADSASVAIRDFPFASGETLPVLRLHYLTLGRLRRDAGGSARNAVLILHGTGGSGSQF